MPQVARRFLLVLPFAIAVGGFFAAPEAHTAPPDEPKAKGTPGKESIYDQTAMGAVIKANYGRVPRSGSELVRALKKVGDFAQLPVTFSAVNLSSGLKTPRVVIAPRPGGKPSDAPAEKKGARKGKDVDPSDPPAKGLPKGLPPGFPDIPGFPGGGGIGGLGGFGGGPQPLRVTPVSTADVTEPTMEGRLFLAANMEKDAEGNIRAKTVEFISWNYRRKKFDFGVIEFTGDTTQMQILDGVRCFTCHKNKGPILSQGPWSNTTHNDVVRATALAAFLPPKKDDEQPNLPKFNNGFGGQFPPVRPGVPSFPILTPDQIEQTTFDGISLVQPDPETCDAAIRQGGSTARDREIYRAMIKSPDGRKAFSLLLAAVATPGPIDQANQGLKQQVDIAFNINAQNFAEDVVRITKSTPDTLKDFAPGGLKGSIKSVVTTQEVGWGGGSSQQVNTVLVWSGNERTVTDYASKREQGDHGLPSAHQPSNQRAFQPQTGPLPTRPSVVANAASVARLIGLTEGDRAFLTENLVALSQQINSKKMTPLAVAKDVFLAPSFLDVFKAGDIPDREEFKDRFVAALDQVAKANKLQGYTIDRSEYASGPNVSGGKEEKEIAVVPTTACLRCHDVRGVGRPAFNPIPMLAFDPFDKASREGWLKNTDAKKRIDVLARLSKRLTGDSDMPPDDSAEYEVFRKKDKANFDAAAAWVEDELKRARGN